MNNEGLFPLGLTGWSPCCPKGISRFFSTTTVQRYQFFSFRISPSSEYSGLISFRIDWFDLAVQGTLKSLFQHHSSKASVLWCSAFFIVQFSYPYMTTGKTIDLTLQTFVSKVISLLFNMLSKFVIAFLPRCRLLSFLPLHSLNHQQKIGLKT